MDPELRQELTRLEQKIDATYKSAEKTRKYMMWSAIIAVVVVVGPLLILPFVIGPFISTYSSIGALQ